MSPFVNDKSLLNRVGFLAPMVCALEHLVSHVRLLVVR
jgi:hypothetical protein